LRRLGDSVQRRAFKIDLIVLLMRWLFQRLIQVTPLSTASAYTLILIGLPACYDPILYAFV
jgi:hypothetical protein